MSIIKIDNRNKKPLEEITFKDTPLYGKIHGVQSWKRDYIKEINTAIDEDRIIAMYPHKQQYPEGAGTWKYSCFLLTSDKWSIDENKVFTLFYSQDTDYSPLVELGCPHNNVKESKVWSEIPKIEGNFFGYKQEIICYNNDEALMYYPITGELNWHSLYSKIDDDKQITLKQWLKHYAMLSSTKDQRYSAGGYYYKYDTEYRYLNGYEKTKNWIKNDTPIQQFYFGHHFRSALKISLNLVEYVNRMEFNINISCYDLQDYNFVWDDKLKEVKMNFEYSLEEYDTVLFNMKEFLLPKITYELFSLQSEEQLKKINKNSVISMIGDMLRHTQMDVDKELRVEHIKVLLKTTENKKTISIPIRKK